MLKWNTIIMVDFYGSLESKSMYMLQVFVQRNITSSFVTCVEDSGVHKSTVLPNNIVHYIKSLDVTED